MEPSPYVTRDEVRHLLAETVDALTEGVCARLASAPASSALPPAVTAEALYDELVRRLQPFIEEAVRRAVAEIRLYAVPPPAHAPAPPPPAPDLLQRLKRRKTHGRRLR